MAKAVSLDEKRMAFRDTIKAEIKRLGTQMEDAQSKQKDFGEAFDTREQYLRSQLEDT